MDNTRNRLLKYISEMQQKDREQRNKRQLHEYKAELSEVSKRMKDAHVRMKKQEAAGDTHAAALSRKAYDYCSRRKTQLEYQVKRLELMKAGTHYFTKDATRPFIEIKGQENKQTG